jgi:aspartate-semialdehyde dehydrogenase
LQKIVFEKESIKYKVVSFDKKKQNVKIEDIETKAIFDIAFAHLPKSVKKQLNPK